MSTTTTEPDPVQDLFASSSVTVHVVRGLIGLVLVVAAFALAAQTAWALLLAVPGVIAWRGCPTCWTLGLIATISRGRISAACDLPR
ncbi:MAG: hypothetical protein F2667_08150 [Actinobacteria bacterium]|uniref:Unannotated protein n=1 Tax=freshwater metagenome TaxID=449393 RepID=A0A6J6QLT0_9ZZZZ|nr:hypothetical protein [Actinomycetota bacterium]